MNKYSCVCFAKYFTNIATPAGGLYIEAPGGIYSESLKSFINAQMDIRTDSIIKLINNLSRAQVDLKFKGVECIFFFSLLFFFALCFFLFHAATATAQNCFPLGIHGKLICDAGWAGRLCDQGSLMRAVLFIGVAHMCCFAF